jgi:hypothetical protein
MHRADKLKESDLLKLKLLIPRENHDSAEKIDPWQNCWGSGAVSHSIVRNLQLSACNSAAPTDLRQITAREQASSPVYEAAVEAIPYRR